MKITKRLPGHRPAVIQYLKKSRSIFTSYPSSLTSILILPWSSTMSSHLYSIANTWTFYEKKEAHMGRKSAHAGRSDTSRVRTLDSKVRTSTLYHSSKEPLILNSDKLDSTQMSHHPTMPTNSWLSGEYHMCVRIDPHVWSLSCP